MTTMASSDGATFCDGAGWLRRCIRRFYDSAARPRFIDGWSASRLDRCLLLGDGPRSRVQVNVSAVARAVECTYCGCAGFLLERRNGVPFAWVPRFALA